MDIDRYKLRQLRGLRGWSQAHLAEVAGVSLKTVRRAEQDGRPSLETLMAFASALQTDTSALQTRSVVTETTAASAVQNKMLLGQYGPLLAAITDVLGEMHHWRRHFADLFHFRGFFYRAPEPPLYSRLRPHSP